MGKARSQNKAKPKQRAQKRRALRVPKNKRKVGRHSLLTKAKTRSPSRRADVQQPPTPKVDSTTQGSSGVVSLSSVNTESCKRKKIEQYRTTKKSQASKRKSTPPNKAKAHQVKTKPNKNQHKPAPEIKWGGKSQREALVVNR